MTAPLIHIVGAGPAGLMAAETLAGGGARVVVHEQMPSVARKLLMAGRGGLNLTHSEPLEGFVRRYGAAAPVLRPMLEAFTPAELIAWAEGLGQATFIGSSGRVFPRGMKASPLLRAWLARLDGLGVQIRTRSAWRGWAADGALVFDTPEGSQTVQPDAAVLALGGASWPRLGATGDWAPWVEARGVALAPFQPANAGVNIGWSAPFRDRFAGTPLKTIAASFGERTVRGEAMITAYGLEGGAVYALGAAVREALDDGGPAVLTLDLRPDLSVEQLAARLARPRGKDTVANWLRKGGGLSPAAAMLLREIPGPVPEGSDKLARRIKGVRLAVTGHQGLERAISSAGGVRLDQVDDRLMLRAAPGVFVAGEMLDWEAPTGGYLLQMCFATGAAAARGVLDWLAGR